VKRATAAVNSVSFGLEALGTADQRQLTRIVRRLREHARDFTS